jgi:ABC-type enterobactin transport system permease subunit
MEITFLFNCKRKMLNVRHKILMALTAQIIVILRTTRKMDLLEIGVNVVDWIGLAQNRYRWRALVNSVMNLPVP